jgi:hypothetical protein
VRLRCREGDLALIIREERGCDSNIGRVVTISGPIEVHTSHGPTWLIEPTTPEPWSYVAPSGEGVVIQPITFADRVEHPDAWLLPLRLGDDLLAEAMKRWMVVEQDNDAPLETAARTDLQDAGDWP